MTAAPGVSIVVVSFNTRDLLVRCLEAAFADSPALSREVVVVDNASVDGSAAAVAERWPAIRLIANPENRGYAPACNQGLRAARGRHVLALNSDAFMRPGALATMVAHLDAHPEIAAVSPRLLNPDGTTQWGCARRAPSLLAALVTHTPLPARLPAIRPWVLRWYPPPSYQASHDVEVLPGACVLFRREALETIGWLDDRLVLNYDDVEWSLRARRHGARLVYLPEAEVVHLGGESRRFLPESTSVQEIRSAHVFWDLWLGPVRATPLKLTMLAGIAASLLKNAVLVPFVPARRPRLALLARAFGEGLRLGLRPGPREARDG